MAWVRWAAGGSRVWCWPARTTKPGSAAKAGKAGKAAAKAEKEAAQTTTEQGAKKADGKGGGKDKRTGMKKHEVKCFNKNDKGDPSEYDRQLVDQENGLNDLTVQEYLEGRWA